MRKPLRRFRHTIGVERIILAKQLIKFGVVGFSNALICLGVYYLLVFISVHYTIAYIIAFLASVYNAYFWNSRYVFIRSSKSEVMTFTKTFITYSGTLLLGVGLLFLMVNTLRISQFIAPLINLSITIPLNFLLNKYWVFKRNSNIPK
jgi:putative flippase GtrA